MSQLYRGVWRALQGMSVGDAFGEAVLRTCGTAEQLARRQCPDGPWHHTSGTVQAAVLMQHLQTNGTIDPDLLVLELAQAYLNDPEREYGSNTRTLLLGVYEGRPWEELSRKSFAGFGSMGSGAATRVVPLGAYFADDLDVVVEAARLSARLTHANNNAIEGAVAVALAVAHFARNETHTHAVWDSLLSRMKPSFTRKRIFQASKLSYGTSVEAAVEKLGNGRWKCAHDTVPFAIWSALRPSRGYEDSLWNTAAGQGRSNILCAIAGGILGAGNRMPSKEWERRAEAIPAALMPISREPAVAYRRSSSSW